MQAAGMGQGKRRSRRDRVRGRDGAGKGGTIKAITERVSPRVFRLVALPAPSDREKSQVYMQRYIPHLPAAGEVVIFDRSWYNRAGVEYVLGFCSAPSMSGSSRWSRNSRRMVSTAASPAQVLARGQQRGAGPPLRGPHRGPAAPMEAESDRSALAQPKWFEYSRARDTMFAATDTKLAPWFIVPSDDKKRARLNVIRHLLRGFRTRRWPEEGDAAGPVEEARLRRPGVTEGQAVRAGQVQMICSHRMWTESPLPAWERGLLGMPPPSPQPSPIKGEGAFACSRARFMGGFA